METLQHEIDAAAAKGYAEGTNAGVKAAVDALRIAVPKIVAEADKDCIEDTQAKVDAILQRVPPGPERDKVAASSRCLSAMIVTADCALRPCPGLRRRFPT